MNQCFYHHNRLIIAKMKALELTKHIFIVLSICPTSKDLRLLTKCLRIAIAITSMVTECMALIASVLFIVKYLENDVQNCLYAIFQVAALFSVIYMWIVAFILRNSISGIFLKFQRIPVNLSLFHLYRNRLFNIIFS